MNQVFTLFFIFFPGLFLMTETYVNASVTDLHILPELTEQIESQVSYGKVVHRLKREGEWTKVRDQYGSEGWLLERELIDLSDLYSEGIVVAKVKSFFAYVYKVDDTTPHPPVIRLPHGTDVHILFLESELNNRWCKMRMLNGEIFWIQSGDLSFNPSLLSQEEVVQLSEKFLYIPYRWGGNTSFGFDCSGFIQCLFSYMGFSLPHSAQKQSESTLFKSVNKDCVRKGDLAFFKSLAGGEHFTHVGLMIDDEYFIHSNVANTTEPAAVRINSIYQEHWVSRLGAVKRLRSKEENALPEDHILNNRIRKLKAKSRR